MTGNKWLSRKNRKILFLPFTRARPDTGFNITDGLIYNDKLNDVVLIFA